MQSLPHVCLQIAFLGAGTVSCTAGGWMSRWFKTISQSWCEASHNLSLHMTLENLCYEISPRFTKKRSTCQWRYHVSQRPSMSVESFEGWLTIASPLEWPRGSTRPFLRRKKRRKKSGHESQDRARPAHPSILHHTLIFVKRHFITLSLSLLGVLWFFSFALRLAASYGSLSLWKHCNEEWI